MLQQWMTERILLHQKNHVEAVEFLDKLLELFIYLLKSWNIKHQCFNKQHSPTNYHYFTRHNL